MATKDLAQTGQDAMTLLDSAANLKTIKNREQAWLANAIANRRYYKAGNPPLAGLAAFVVAAGPSLKKNVQALKTIGRRGVIICVEAAYRYLMEQGITPEYCISIDADARMLSMIEGVSTENTTLVAMASAAPALVAAWQGPKFFLRCIGGAKDIDERLVAVAREVRALRDIKVGEILNPIEDIAVDFPGLSAVVVTGGNVTGAAHSLAWEHFRAKHVIFVGADYSWSNIDEFYAGGAHKALSEERQEEQIFTHPAPGGEVCTNLSMFNFKTWHEDYVHARGMACVNASEGGILGINRLGRVSDGWEHMPLAAAISRYAPQ